MLFNTIALTQTLSDSPKLVRHNYPKLVRHNQPYVLKMISHCGLAFIHLEWSSSSLKIEQRELNKPVQLIADNGIILLHYHGPVGEGLRDNLAFYKSILLHIQMSKKNETSNSIGLFKILWILCRFCADFMPISLFSCTLIIKFNVPFMQILCNFMEFIMIRFVQVLCILHFMQFSGRFYAFYVFFLIAYVLDCLDQLVSI